MNIAQLLDASSLVLHWEIVIPQPSESLGPGAVGRDHPNTRAESVIPPYRSKKPER
jgi:hypothetical protein